MNSMNNALSISVVDDTPANLRLLDELLREKGYQVRLFPRGALALKAAETNPPDLFLLDIMMPEMDGFEVCRQLKANPALRNIPVIFISALADTENKVKAFAHGGMDYVTKPFQEGEVLARVHTHLALYAMQQTQARQQADLAQLVDERTADLLRAQRVAHIGSWKLDFQTQALHWSPETYRIFGVPEGTPVYLTDFLDKVHPQDRDNVIRQWTLALQGHPYDVEHRIAQPAGAEWVRERAEFGLGPDGQPHTAWGTAQDITETKAHQAQVDFITHHDVLTGLPNRAHFLDLLRVCMANSTVLQSQLAVAYIDLDGFAGLNAQFGRDAGNQLLMQLGKRLAMAVRERQYLARIGGDEFAVIMTGLKTTDDYLQPVQRMLEAVSQPLDVQGHTTQVTASIGISQFPQSDSVEAEQLLRQADQAMYLAKLAGKNRLHVFDPMKDESTRERFMRIEEVRQGLTQGEMRLYYQPKISLSSGEVVGFEALIRWQHPQRGLVPPGQFIPLLEQHPLAIQVGNWVIETALAQLARWNADGMHTCLSVNIESLQLQDPDFVPRLARQLAAQPSVEATQLELEILETGALNNMAHVSRLIAQLNGMGVACALDDFGTGYSSLTFLKQLAVQTIKIDQSFVRGMLDDSEHASIVNSVLGLARSFDRRTLAEGVETEAHGQMLVELGCEMAQGYAIARPMPAEAVNDWLDQWLPPRSWQATTPLEQGDVPLLMGEVEHRAWMKTIKACLDGQQDFPAPQGHDTCRLGHWLSKPATQQRYGHLNEFKSLVQQHAAVRATGVDLLQHVGLNTDTDRQTSWHRLQTQSKALIATLQGMRQSILEPISIWQ
ncbi:MAG: EAL domain-containing protein [Hydrogenophaga sp.]|uniref:EAL domain-containing protein n=1 Tax=Hydrogenophaga sp. TaxID=1904254 RepID=UPI002ABAFD40|nr:EAL domain-containing protein [Hydrogenophaga sp.]MDZ4188502.1 EAL domain-containing protein [Hydrogenophaga sp.]